VSERRFLDFKGVDRWRRSRTKFRLDQIRVLSGFNRKLKSPEFCRSGLLSNRIIGLSPMSDMVFQLEIDGRWLFAIP